MLNQFVVRCLIFAFTTFLLTNACLVAVCQDQHESDRERNRLSDVKLFNAAKDVMQLKKITLDSKVDDLKIPAYLFQPKKIRSDGKHPALVWVYGGIHDHFGTNYFPFIKEATEQGYVVIAPEYRGASGLSLIHI